MKALKFGSLAALVLVSSVALAGGRKDYVSVTFDAAKNAEVRSGDSLDGSVKFFFADEKNAPKSTEGELSARGSSFKGKDDEDKCAKSVAVALLSFQKRAKKDGFNAVVDIRSYSESNRFSGKRSECQCVAGGSGARTTLKGRLANVK